MTERITSPASRVAAGAAAGLIAGLAASLAMDLFQRATQPAGDEGEPATQQAADGIARDVTGEPLSDQAKPIGGQLVHYGLGAALGVGDWLHRTLRRFQLGTGAMRCPRFTQRSIGWYLRDGSLELERTHTHQADGTISDRPQCA